MLRQPTHKANVRGIGLCSVKLFLFCLSNIRHVLPFNVNLFAMMPVNLWCIMNMQNINAE